MSPDLPLLAPQELTVLVVDDEPSVLKVVGRILQGAGYRVLSAASGSEALQIAQRESPGIGLLLTDVIMPEMDGQELANRLRAIIPDLKVLFTSGYTDDILDPEGIKLPGFHLLEKPYSPSDLTSAVREVLCGIAAPGTWVRSEA